MKSFRGRTLFPAFCVFAAALAAPAQQASSTKATPAIAPDATSSVTTTGGTADYLTRFTGTSTVANSIIYDNGANVGIGIVPVGNAKLDLNGNMILRGNMTVARTGNATSSKAYPSYGFQFFSNTYNSSTKTTTNPFFTIQSEPTGNDTSSPGATLNFLYSNPSGVGAETGLYFNPNGTIHFSSAQTFPIAAGPQGPAGPAGPKGATGATGATGPQGPAGGLNLPYASYAAEDGYPVFEIRNIGVSNSTGGSDGIAGYGGNSGTSQSFNYGGSGITGFGGVAANTSNGYSYGGPGVTGNGGDGNASDSATNGGAGGLFNGGSGGEGFGGSGVTAVGGSPSGDGIDAFSQQGGYAGFFSGPVDIVGTLYKSSGAFKIDDPADPANKYLVHSFVESPDMMNIYNGTVTTNGSGEAVVEMPAWFESLNRDFRYQLTTIGTFSRAMIASEISNGKFVIQTEKGNVKVSWQVTGVRQDAWANAHRLPTEVDKSDAEKGHYLHPELFGHAGEPDVHQAAHRAGIAVQAGQAAATVLP